MKPKLKVLFVFNRSSWSTTVYKLQQIKDFFLPAVELSIEIKHTNFTNIPFETVKTLDGTSNQYGVDTHNYSETVQDAWLDQNVILPSIAGTYDIVVFVLADTDKEGHVTSAGIRGDREQGAVECIIFGGDENYRTYVNGVDIGNSFVVFSCHEISHAIYMILGLPDNTHKYFYSGQPIKVLNDFVFPVPNTADRISLIQRAFVFVGKLLVALLIKKKEMSEETITEDVSNNKIGLFCQAIKKHEGYYEPNDEYPKGSRSWRNKNPGNVKYLKQLGTVGEDSSGFAIFSSYNLGFSYLYRMVENTCKGLSAVRGANYTISQFFAGTPEKDYRDAYAPERDNNDPTEYARVVALAVGVPVTTKMKDLL